MSTVDADVEVRGYRGAPLPAPPLDPVRLARRSPGS